MSELLFAVKMAAITFVLVIVMQVRVSDVTLEEHAHTWIQTATPVLFLREVAEGGLAAANDAWSKMTAGIKTKYWNKYDKKQIPGQRQLGTIERSEAYLDEQKVKADALAEEQKRKKEKVEAELAARAKRVREAIGLDQNEEEPTEETKTE
jgi:hypothetical protein